MGTVFRVALALLLGLTAAAAQRPLETRGAWHLVPDGEDFALRTQALMRPDTIFSLYCRKAQQLYAFEIKSSDLAARSRGEDIRVGFKLDDNDTTWFNLASGPDGTVPVSHQTVFWIIYPALTRNDAKIFGFAVGERAWLFQTEGLREMTEKLTTRCGFEPPRASPERRQRSTPSFNR